MIGSGANDHVFVNFADHGGPGLIAFPSSVLHVAQLNKTIWKMYEEKKYHKMVSRLIDRCICVFLLSYTMVYEKQVEEK